MPADEPGSITRWLPGLRAGDHTAISALWQRYLAPLLEVARRRLGSTRALDEYDVVVEAFLGFCATARKPDHFPELRNRNNVIRLLVRFTLCRAFDVRVKEERRRRILRGESALGEAGLGVIPGGEPPAEVQTAVTDLLDMLDRDELRQIAQLRLEGYQREEIAERMDCSLATVDRRLGDIRAAWKSVWQDEEG